MTDPNIRKFTFGKPFPTGAVIRDVPETAHLPYLTVSEDGSLSMSLAPETILYGLGPTVRGLNKRGWLYESANTDDSQHTEEKHRLYSSHNFLIVDGPARFALFLDTPGRVVWNLGYTDSDRISITADDGFTLYLWEAETLPELVRGLRVLTGAPYVPPLWAFGFNQSRWGYRDENDLREVIRRYRELDMPLDMVSLDLDYMEGCRDFTVSRERFPDFADFNRELAGEGIHMVPIVDAALKADEAWPVYRECLEKGFFCRKEDGSPFFVGVWPGKCVLPDFADPEAAAWFGRQYRALTDAGVRGFWNDMNEPAIFYSEDCLREVFEKIRTFQDRDLDLDSFFEMRNLFGSLSHRDAYLRDYFHTVGGERIRGDKLRNIYGTRMTEAAAKALKEQLPDERVLLFSRSSYIGLHRSAGIWYGDNRSWWSHLKWNVAQAAAAGMSGFLYSGADIGGFGGDATGDLALRWLAFGIFSPLFRNHSIRGSRPQEFWRFGREEAFRGVLKLRYALLPFIYSEFVKAALSGGMYFLPLSFVFSDARSRRVEDQLMIGEGVMTAPVCEQNADGRFVYLPEPMRLFRMRGPKDFDTELLPAGDHFLSCALNEVLIFVRRGYCLPLAETDGVRSSRDVDFSRLSALKYDEAPVSYTLYDDGGVRSELSLEKYGRTLVF